MPTLPVVVSSDDGIHDVFSGGVASVTSEQTELELFPSAGVRQGVATKLGTLTEEVRNIFLQSGNVFRSNQQFSQYGGLKCKGNATAQIRVFAYFGYNLISCAVCAKSDQIVNVVVACGYV